MVAIKDINPPAGVAEGDLTRGGLAANANPGLEEGIPEGTQAPEVGDKPTVKPENTADKPGEDPLAAFNPQPYTAPAADPLAAFNPKPYSPDISGADLKALDPTDLKAQPWYTRTYQAIKGAYSGMESFDPKEVDKFRTMLGGKLGEGDYMLLGAARVLDTVSTTAQLAYRGFQAGLYGGTEAVTGDTKLARDLASMPDAFAGMPGFAAGHALGEVKVTGGARDVPDLNLHYDAMRAQDSQTARVGRELTTEERATIIDKKLADPTAPFPQGKAYEALAPKPEQVQLPPKSPYAAYGNVDKLQLTIAEWKKLDPEWQAKAVEAQSWLDDFLKSESGSLNISAISGFFAKTVEEPEKVTGAAMRDGENIASGINHAEAAGKLEDTGHNGFGGEHGYATNKRPFVPEAEANMIAETQGQLNQDGITHNANVRALGIEKPPLLASEDVIMHTEPPMDQVRVHTDHEATMLEADRQVNNHRPAVSLAASELGKAVLGKDFDNTMSGGDLYQAMADKIGPAATSQMLAKAGVAGLKVDGGHYVFDSRIVEPRVVDGQPVIADTVPSKAPVDPASIPNRTVTDVKGNILLDRIRAPEEALGVMEQAAIENDGFAAERAGTASNSSIMAAAEMTGLPAEEIAKSGQFKNDSVLRTVFKAMNQSAADWATKGKAFVNQNDFASLKAVIEGRMQHSYIQGVLTGKIAEAGRTLAVVKEFYNNAIGREKPLALPPNARTTLEGLKKAKEDAGIKLTEANQAVAEAERGVTQADFGEKTAANQAVKVAKRAAKTAGEDAKTAIQEHDELAAKVKDQQPAGSLAEFHDTVKDEATLEKWLKTNTGESLDDVKKMAADVSKLDPEALTKYAAKTKVVKPPTIGQRFESGARSLWTNFLLSNPLSHIKYAISMEGLFAYDNASIVAGGIATLSHEQVAEGVARFISQGQGIWSSLKSAGDVIKNDRYIQLPSEIKYDKKGVAIEGVADKNTLTSEASSIPIPGIKEVAEFAAGAATAPIRVIKGIHSFYAMRGYMSELQAWGVRAAEKQGFRPWEGGFWDKVNEHVNNPYSEAMEGATDAAEIASRRLTFTTPLGSMGKKGAAFIHATPLGFVLDPFTHVPVNIAKEGVRLTPGLNLFSPIVRNNLLGRNGVPAQSMEAGHMVLGGALSYTAINMVLNGTATGDPPIDPGQRSAWNLDHMRSAVAIGDQWWSYQRTGPIGMVFGLAAKAAQVGLAVHQGLGEPDSERRENDYAQAGYLMAHAIGSIIDDAGLQNFGDVLTAVDDPQRGAARWIQSTVAEGLVPFSSFSGAVASSMDPYIRRVDGVFDAMLNKLPGERQTLAPEIDRLGRPVVNPRFGVMGGIVPHKAIDRDPLIGEMQRLGIAAAPMAKHIDGVLMTPAQQNELQVTFGETAASLLEEQLHTPGWRNEPDIGRKEFITGMFKSARETATGIMQAKYPDQFIAQPAENQAAVVNGTRKSSGFTGMFPEAPQ